MSSDATQKSNTANGNGNGRANANGNGTGTAARDLCGAVLVCGAGVAGIQASLDLSAAGFRVYLVEENPAVGGGMARLDKTFPTGDCATCIISPKLVECMRDLNIDVLTMADVVSLEGEAGNFTATVRQRPRFVDPAKCTACGECTKVCPVEVTSVFDAGVGTRKAIDRFYAQAAPNANFIRKNGRAACSSGCPIDSSVQGYVALIAAGKFAEAARVIRRENPLPSICGRVCFHPCELMCNRGQIDEPVNIRGLKRFALDQVPVADAPASVTPSGKTVAIVGSGPAGLAAAHALALAGHRATVFEALPVLGGMLAVGIPDYRLPPDILARDIDAIRALGVEFETGAAVGAQVSVERLEKDFDAIFVATGAHDSLKLGVPGEDGEGVVHGVDYLRGLALGKPVAAKGKRVVVVGGGNTAIDAARTALRAGAAKVSILYRRTRAEMPASAEEIEATLAEGIDIQYLAAPVKVLAEQDKVVAIECVRMELGEPDASGRRRPVPKAGSEFRVAVDLLIPAISQSADQRLAQLLSLKTSKWGTIEADKVSMATSKPGVFAGGDVVAGPSSVIDAIAHGKRAASAIDNYLSGRPWEEGIKAPAERPNSLSEQDLARLKKKKARAGRVQADELPVAGRVGGFGEVELPYTREQAQAEARRCLNCAGCSECMLCVDACQAGAINHNDAGKTLDLNVGAVLLTPGFEAFDATRRGEFGYGFAPNVVSNVQFERILSASGPTGGHVVRPSDGKAPKRLAFIQCVGSRDSGCENDYCSSVCCMAATKEAILAKEHEPDLDVTVFFLDLRAFGKDFDRYAERAARMGVRYVRSFVSRTYDMPGTRNLQLTYVNPETMQRVDAEFDMVVLSLGMEPSASLQAQATSLGVKLNRWGFAETSDLRPLETSRAGVYVGGAFQEPKDIPDTVMQASAAASRAMSLLAPARGSLTRVKAYPPERDIADEPPRVGVFVCHCGSNIASVVDVERVVASARELPHVVFAGNAVYACSDDSQDVIKKTIAEHRLNRVVIASCTPRTHEPIFRDTLRDAGLNPYLLEMANIRDQCSWVHSGDPEGATRKAEDLVRMIVGRASALVPLREEKVPVKNGALVIGGGVAGMTAALALADQGFPVHLVEKGGKLGGTALDIYKTLDGTDVQAFVGGLVDRVTKSPRVTVHLETRVAKVNGHIGEFKSTLVPVQPQAGAAASAASAATHVEHGVVVVATGAKEHKPATYGYGKSDKVMTQLELSGKLGRGELKLADGATVVMIQCVEQRSAERPYCSRVCCTTAVSNALQIKERFPKARVMVLYRDMRTYGFREAAYRKAREKGVLFVRFDEKRPPELSVDGQLALRVHEPSLGRPLEVQPDLVVLATPMVPRADREELSELLRVPLNADGFFLEAHVKLRPVDFASEGLFLCGTAHAPKSIGETISQANAAASRAASILSRKEMAVSGQTAWVDPDKCISCMTCAHVCAYGAPRPNEFNKAEIQGAVCMGCGSCVAECPAKAIELRNYIDDQILGAMDSLLRVGPGSKEMELDFLEQVGVAQPRWHKQ